MNPTPELFIKMTFDAWNVHVARVSNLLNELTDDQLKAKIAPNKNSGVYIVAHLVAIHDKMLPLLSLGEQEYPKWFDAYVDEADGPAKSFPATSEIRENWTAVSNKLSNQFKQLSVEDWFKRHHAVNEEDFKKEPHRNRLNLVINRTNHLAYHFGQLILLKKND